MHTKHITIGRNPELTITTYDAAAAKLAEKQMNARRRRFDTGTTNQPHTTMNINIENTAHLTRDQLTSVRMIADTIRSQAFSLTDAANWLRELSGYVYEGGSHVAYHLHEGDGRRVIIVTQ